MKLFTGALICSLLISTAGFTADDKAKIRIVTPNPDHTCATHFLGIYEQLERFKGRAIDVGIGNLSHIGELLTESGLPAEQAKFYANAIEGIAVGATDAVDVLGQVLAFLRNVWTDEGLFGVSVPKREPVKDIAPFTSHYAVNAPFKFVGKFAAAPAYNQVPRRPEYPQYDEKTFWNGLILYPLAFDQAQDDATAFVTTVSKFFNMAAQLHAEFMLGHLSRYIQSGGKAHAKLGDFIFSDGKEIDYGFARLFAETRGAAAEIQAAQYALALINVPEREIQRWAQHHAPLIVKQALERLGKAPVQAQPILDELGITEATFMSDWKKLTGWVEHRGK